MVTVRSNFSASEERTAFIESFGSNSSEAVCNLTEDYLTSLCDLDDAALKELGLAGTALDEVADHRKKLKLLEFKLERLFDKENNDEICTAWFAIVEAKDIPKTEEMFRMGINNFFGMCPLLQHMPYTKHKMTELFTEKYCNGGEYTLKEYTSFFDRADRIEIWTYQNNVREVYAYRQDELIDYEYAAETIGINAYRRKLSRITGYEWQQADKEQGSNVYTFY